MIDVRQTLEYANYLSKIGWSVERINKVNYFIKKFPLIGSVIKIQRPEKINYPVIKRLIDKYRAFQIIIEPKTKKGREIATRAGFRLSKSPFLPTKTLHIDLTLSEIELHNRLKKDAKYSLRKATNNKLQEMNSNIEEFRNAWKKAVGWKHYVPPLSHLAALGKSFDRNSLFLISENNNSGGIFIIGDKIAYYWQAFTNKQGRKQNVQYKIVWEGIVWAKKKGAKVFDFEGIYDERFPNKSWFGFTHFKKSFGGNEIEFPGAFIKIRLSL